MIRFAILLLLLLQTLFASNILEYHFYERSDRVDIMLSFDTPYKGKIIQREDGQSIILTLLNSTIENRVEKKLNSEIVQKIQIIPYLNRTFIEITSDKLIKVTASKTIDEFGLRIRIRLLNENNTNQTQIVKPIKKSEKLKIETKEDDIDLSYKYIVVILIMTILLIILYFLKNRTLNQSERNSWLFSGLEKSNKNKKHKLHILYQKEIDTKNRVSLIEYNNSQYLVIIGSTNVLLDKFKKDNEHIENEDDFNQVFEEKRRKLKDFLQSSEKKLDSYKKKVSKSFDL